MVNHHPSEKLLLATTSSTENKEEEHSGDCKNCCPHCELLCSEMRQSMAKLDSKIDRLAEQLTQIVNVFNIHQTDSNRFGLFFICYVGNGQFLLLFFLYYWTFL